MKRKLSALLVLICGPLLSHAQDFPPFYPPDLSYERDGAKTAEYDGQSITFLDRGDGSPILPFMYVGGGYPYWQTLIEAASDDYRVLAPDGHSFTLPQLKALIEYADAGPADIVTHSAASWIAIYFAQRHPELVNSLILLEPAYGPDLESVQAAAEVFVTSCELTDQPADIIGSCLLLNSMSGPGYAERIAAVYLAPINDSQANMPIAEVIRRSDLPTAGAELAEQGWQFPYPPICDISQSLNVPILVIRGSISTESNRIGLDAHEACMPDHETVVIDGTTHFAHFEKPDEFNAVVLDFIARHGNEER